MGNDNHWNIEQGLYALEFGAHAPPQKRVESGKRFIQEQQPGLADQCPGKGDPLPLPPGEGAGIAV